MYFKYNAVLRAETKDPFLVKGFQSACGPAPYNKYVTTIHAINSCVIKVTQEPIDSVQQAGPLSHLASLTSMCPHAPVLTPANLHACLYTPTFESWQAAFQAHNSGQGVAWHMLRCASTRVLGGGPVRRARGYRVWLSIDNTHP